MIIEARSFARSDVEPSELNYRDDYSKVKIRARGSEIRRLFNSVLRPRPLRSTHTDARTHPIRRRRRRRPLHTPPTPSSTPTQPSGQGRSTSGRKRRANSRGARETFDHYESALLLIPRRPIIYQT
jgi:hypothetical protein